MEEEKRGWLDLSKRGLKKVERAADTDKETVVNLILDHNELQRIDNIDSYSRIENLSICNNFLLRMHGVSKLSNIRILSLNNNGILQIEGLKELIYLKTLKLSGNNIKTIEHLNHNTHLEHLDLSNNQISFVADISYLKNLKYLSVERNRMMDLRQCDRYLPASLEHLGVAHNNLQDLNELSHLAHLNRLESFTLQGNPCVQVAGKEKMGFDYRPFVINWIMNVKSIDGFVVSAIESLKAEWLYSQGRGRGYRSGQHAELCAYLASTCPLTAEALDTEDQRKLRLILSKAQHHQMQLKDQSNSPVKSKLQSPRMQSRISSRSVGKSPDRLSNSYYSAVNKSTTNNSPMSMSCSGDITSSGSGHSMSAGMCQSYDSPGLMFAEKTPAGAVNGRERAGAQELQPVKPVNQPLEAASKMVPVPESLMSPDYQDPAFDLQRNITKLPRSQLNTSNSSNNSSPREPNDTTEKIKYQMNKGSPKLTRSAMSSPKLRAKVEQRKGSLSKLNITNNSNECINKNLSNGTPSKQLQRNNSSGESDISAEKLQVIKAATNQRRQRKMSNETMAAVTIQKMWRGYHSRNLNKEALRILHAIQAARARQHIQRLTCDMEATKAALDSERKIQQLQMQAINALWKKVSALQTAGETKCNPSETDQSSEAMRQLTETCFCLQTQVVELQGCMQEVLRAVSSLKQDSTATWGCAAAPAATQTDIVAVLTPQEERCSWLRRPQSLALSAPSAPTQTVAAPAQPPAADRPRPPADQPTQPERQSEEPWPEHSPHHDTEQDLSSTLQDSGVSVSRSEQEGQDRVAPREGESETDSHRLERAGVGSQRVERTEPTERQRRESESDGGSQRRDGELETD